MGREQKIEGARPSKTD